MGSSILVTGEVSYIQEPFVLNALQYRQNRQKERDALAEERGFEKRHLQPNFLALTTLSLRLYQPRAPRRSDANTDPGHLVCIGQETEAQRQGGIWPRSYVSD